MNINQLGLFEDSNTPINKDTSAQKIHFLALASIRGIGFQTLKKIYKRYGGFDIAWDFSYLELKQFLFNADVEEIHKIVDSLRNKKGQAIEKAQVVSNGFRNRNIQIVFDSEVAYPKRLSNIPDAPLWLFVEGNSSLLSKDNLIAVVGSRSASSEGLEATRKLSTILSRHDLTIVSGLAEGIDAVAHQTTVDYGNSCIAVLGTGISVVFPSSTAGLRARIVECGGALVTEYLPNDSYSKDKFIQRNRIQAALSSAIIPVEWSMKGGTAHTVSFAEKYNRPIIFINGMNSDSVRWDEQIHTSLSKHYFIKRNSDQMEVELLAILNNIGISFNQNVIANYESKKLFSSLLTEFMRVINSYNVDEATFSELLNNLKSSWEKRKDGH